MKILLTGSMHTGKSTLLSELSGRSGLGIVPEVARELIAANPQIETRAEFQDILFHEQTRRETEAVLEYPIVVCDRGILDNIVHSRYYGHQVNPEWEKWLDTYGSIYVLDKEDVHLDLSRYPAGQDWGKFRDDLQRITFEVIEYYSLPYTLLSGTVEGRSRQVLREIGDLERRNLMERR